VDSLLVISNDKLRQQYGDLVLSDAFAKADNVLTTAARGIAELITVTGYVNVDFEDVKTVIKDSGRAIMGSARAEGEDRAIRAIEAAMNSPLLNDNDVKGATDILLYIMTGNNDITMDEITEITEYVQRESGEDADIIWGTGADESLGNSVGITIIATGFDSIKPKAEIEQPTFRVGTVGDSSNIPSDNLPVTTKPSPQPEKAKAEEVEFKIVNKSAEREIHTESTVKTPEAKIVHSMDNRPSESGTNNPNMGTTNLIRRSDKPYLSVGHTVSSQQEKPAEKPLEYKTSPAEDEEAGIQKNASERINKLKNLSINLRSAEQVAQLESQPAYIRKKIELEETNYSSDTVVSRFTLGEDSKNNTVIKSDNSFLHDNVD